MTSRERLLAVLRRETPDTVPVFVKGVSPFGENMNFMGRFDESYERLRRLVYDTADIFHPVGFDTGTFLSAGIPLETRIIREDADWRDVESTIETPAGPLTSVTRSSRHNQYEVMTVKFWLESMDDFERLMRLPYRPVRPAVAEVMARKDSEVGERGLPYVGIPSVIMFMHVLLGSEGLATWSVMHRERLRELVEIFSVRVLEYVKHLLSEGAGPVFSYAGPELAVPPLMSPRDFHEFVTIPDKPVHELIHASGFYTWVHSHGRLDEVLEEFAEMGADILEPLEVPPGGNVTLSEAKSRIGQQVVLMGNMPYDALIYWPAEKIQAKVESDCRAAMKGGGFIMMPAASPFEPVLSDTGFEGYRAYIEAGRRYGRYS